MFKAGQKVYLLNNMSKKGVILEVKFEKPKAWLSGGVSSDRLNCIIQFEDDSIGIYNATEIFLDN